MTEKAAKKQRKGSIGEQDVATLLQRYSATTVLAMLHEVSQCTGAKRIDWNALVEKTSTGISSAREYQMLWRHIAYRDTLFEKLEDGAQPLDDDSDLEFELEAFPSVSGEASAEAAACVKVLIASGAPTNDSNPNGSTVEAPLTINIPNCPSARDTEQPSCSMQGTNITVPVSVQKQPAPSTTVTEGLVSNGSAGGNFNKRKRKPWSEAEDMELIAAVQKCGEGNWANILRGDFKGDRTASQLSQRWAIIRKRHGNLNVGGNSNGTQLSEAQLAARHAMSLALNFPVKNLTSNTIGNGGTMAANKSAGTSTNNNTGTSSNSNTARTNASNNSQPAPSAAETSTGGNNILQSQKQSQENPASKPSPVGSSGPAAKPRVPPMKKTILKSNPSSSDAMVRATAVAAGARIASASDAASLLKAAQGKNAIHIMPSGGGSIKPSIPGGVPSLSETHPNVHYIRTGLAHSPISSYAAVTPSVPSAGPVKPVPPAARHAPTTNGTSSDVSSSKQNNDVSSTPSRELPLKQEVVKTREAMTVPESGSSTKEQIQGNITCVSEKPPDELAQDSKVASLGPDAESKGSSGKVASLGPDAESKGSSGTKSSVSSSNLKTAENNQEVIVVIEPKKADENGKTNGTVAAQPGACENKDAIEKNGENQNIDKMEEDLQSVVTDVEKNGENQNIDKVVEKNGESQNIDKKEADLPSMVTVVKDGENQSMNKTEADLPNVVTDAGKNGEDRNIDKMEEDLPSKVLNVEKNGENKNVAKTQ